MPNEQNTDEYPDGCQRWMFGRATGQTFTRPVAQGSKQSITTEELKGLMVYDVPLDVSIDNLPPANVILSSNLAYHVARLVHEIGCLSFSQLHRFWPGNFTTKGHPCANIEPMGRPAVVTTSNNDREYGIYNGYVYCGSYGF